LVVEERIVLGMTMGIIFQFTNPGFVCCVAEAREFVSLQMLKRLLMKLKLATYQSTLLQNVRVREWQQFEIY
jgi:hypothetical protein